MRRGWAPPRSTRFWGYRSEAPRGPRRTRARSPRLPHRSAGPSISPGPTHPLPGEDPQRLDAVLPGDLLALFTGARPVADRHLVGPDPPAQQLAGDLGLHAEPAPAHVQRLVQLDRHQPEARLEVAEVA